MSLENEGILVTLHNVHHPYLGNVTISSDLTPYLGEGRISSDLTWEKEDYPVTLPGRRKDIQ